jgi:uncharacterized membrane protein YkgB
VPTEIVTATVTRLDQRIAETMRRLSFPMLRVALAIVYVWFGILKPFGVSPAEPLVLATVSWMPLFAPHTWLAVIGWWEVLIGLTFLHPRTTRVAIGLLALQMGGTLLPLAILPEVTFQPGRWPWAPTVEGQYIIKNVLIIAAALTLGGRVRSADTRPAYVRAPGT